MVAFISSPLGPFVPAPPEIAMHMMREQGGPPPFEPNGAPHGNTGVLGTMLGGPAPIITMPSNFRHDPRRLRRLELFTKFHACILYIYIYIFACTYMEGEPDAVFFCLYLHDSCCFGFFSAGHSFFLFECNVLACLFLTIVHPWFWLQLQRP
jgi:hypothetical protein